MFSDVTFPCRKEKDDQVSVWMKIQETATWREFAVCTPKTHLRHRLGFMVPPHISLHDPPPDTSLLSDLNDGRSTRQKTRSAAGHVFIYCLQRLFIVFSLWAVLVFLMNNDVLSSPDSLRAVCMACAGGGRMSIHSSIFHHPNPPFLWLESNKSGNQLLAFAFF